MQKTSNKIYRRHISLSPTGSCTCSNCLWILFYLQICPSLLLWLNGGKKILTFNLGWCVAMEHDSRLWPKGHILIPDTSAVKIAFQRSFLLVERRPLVIRCWHLKITNLLITCMHKNWLQYRKLTWRWLLDSVWYITRHFHTTKEEIPHFCLASQSLQDRFSRQTS